MEDDNENGKEEEDGIEHASVEHPLRYLNDAALEKDVQKFVEDNGFGSEMAQRMQRGASVAKYSEFYRTIAIYGHSDDGTAVHLDEDEREALKNETQSLFKQTHDMYITVATCAVAALVQGWDQVGPNGANLYWPGQLCLYPSQRTRWILGVVNAAPYLASSIAGVLLTDVLNARIGRRGTIMFATLWCFASVLGSAFATSWRTLLSTRMLLGIGMGTKASTVPVFAAESAPAYWRGSIGLNWQLWVACGISAGLSANLVFIVLPPDLAWRFQLGSATLPAIPLLFLAWSAPETPRWYMKKGTPEDCRKAYKSLRRLRPTDLQTCRDLYFAYKQLQVEKFHLSRDRSKRSSGDSENNASKLSQSKQEPLLIKFVELFRVGRNRRALLASVTVMITQQLCGINVLAFYSSTFFLGGHKKNHSTIRNALLYSWAFGMLNALLCLPAVVRIDRIGRRPLLLFSLFNMSWTIFVAGCAYLITNHKASVGISLTFVFLFTIFYSPGQGPVPFTYAAEAFPLSHREVGVSLSVAVNLFWAGILGLFFPQLSAVLGSHQRESRAYIGANCTHGDLHLNEAWKVNKLGYAGVLWVFAGLNLVALMLVYLFVPETARKTLEAQTEVFNISTLKHVKHQLEVLQKRFLRHILRKKEVIILSLVPDHFDHETREARAETFRGVGDDGRREEGLDSDKE